MRRLHQQRRASGGVPSDYGRRQNDNCRRDLHDKAYKQRHRVGPLRILELGEQGRSKREAELVDGDDETDNAREMVFRELLLNDEARQRGRVSDANPEQQATQVERRFFRARRQDPHAECLDDEIDGGDGTTLKRSRINPVAMRPATAANRLLSDSEYRYYK